MKQPPKKTNNSENAACRNIVENMPIPLVVVDMKGTPIFANQAALKFAGIKNLDKANIYDFVEARFLKKVLDRKNSIKSGQKLPPVKIDTHDKKNNQRTIEIHTQAIEHEGKKAMQVIFIDVTNHKLLQEQKIKTQLEKEKNQALKRKQEEIETKHGHLEAVLNSTEDTVFVMDKKCCLIEVNEAFRNDIRRSRQKEVQTGDSILKLLPKEQGKKIQKSFKKALQGESVFVSDSLITIKGQKYMYEAQYRPVRVEGKIIGVAVFSKNVTEKETSKQELLNKETQLSTIINTTNDIIFSVNRNCEVIQSNIVMQEIALLRSGKEMLPGMNFLDFVSKEKRTQLKETYTQVLSGQAVTAIETYIHPKYKDNRIYEANYNPITNPDGSVVGMSVFARDITEQKKNEEKIKHVQLQLASIINNSTDVVVSIDKNYRIVQFNTLLYQVVEGNYKFQVQVGDSIFRIIEPNLHSDIKNIYDLIFAKGISKITVEMFPVNSVMRYYETNYNPIKENDEVIGIAIFSRDITQKIMAEKELKEALKEKEVLLKEVHHRVKNNLQVISSILNLQTSYLKDKSTVNLLKECQNRIKTMSFIHESLYQTKDFSQINFSEYITLLVKNLFYSYDANQQKIKANFDIDSIFLNLDTSIPCGLIINELVSNAFKYAFADGKEGFIFVQLKKMKNGKISMIVADNGKGIPDTVDFKNTESLGLQLVNILTQQINGEVTLNKTNGTKFEITFNP
ncbi:MAG: PAS domain S-box protein [Bacteroidetes bacterium]|nr:PAS domain S-box protein [Bacteroidota bacterium]